MILIAYLCIRQIQSLLRLKGNYFRRFWTYIDLGIIVCSLSAIGTYIAQYREAKGIGDLFRKTNGFAYINLQRSAYINDLQNFFLAFSCFFSCLNVLRLGQYHRQLRLFTDTLRHASKDLLSFAVMFSVVFIAFLSLFYFIFISSISSCSTLLQTARMLFEMSLMKFDTHELLDAQPFLGPMSFTLFIFVVVFVCMSMFITIIGESFRCVRDDPHLQSQDDRHLLSCLLRKCQYALGISAWGRRQSQLLLERDERMRSAYLDAIEHFPDKIDQLLLALDRVRPLVESSATLDFAFYLGIRESTTIDCRNPLIVRFCLFSDLVAFLKVKHMLLSSTMLLFLNNKLLQSRSYTCTSTTRACRLTGLECLR